MKFKQVIDLLTTLNPELFTKEFIKHPKPLPLKVHLYLIDKYLELTKESKTTARRVVGSLLWRFTNRPSYWRSIMRSTNRVDLHGVEDSSSPVELEHKIDAKVRLENFNDRKYWRLATEGDFDKVLKDLVSKEREIVDLKKVFVAASVQLANFKTKENITEQQIEDLIDYQTKKIIKRLVKTKGISFFAYLPDDTFIKVLTELYAIHEDIYAIQVNGKVYKCEAFYAKQVQYKNENELENSEKV